MRTRMKAVWTEFDRLTKRQQHHRLIKWGILNPDGSLKRFPLSPVPYGPRE